MSTNVGQQLRQARQVKNLSLQQISRATYIRVTYLEALEAGQLDRLPSLAQARGFLRTYANQLGLPADELLAGLKGERTEPHPVESPSPLETIPHEDSTENFFAEIGQVLRQHRELLGLKLEDIELQTRIRTHYLQALEAGNLDVLPSPVQGRGMLNNYAAFLGLDPDPLLLKFADGLQARLTARRGSRAGQLDPRSAESTLHRGGRAISWRRFLSSDLLFGGALGIGLLLFVVWGAIRISSLGSEEQLDATAPAIVDVLAPEDTATPTPTLGTPGAEITSENNPETNGEATLFPEIQLPLNEDAVQLYIVVRQRAWMRITVDGTIEFEGRVIPGNAYSYSGEDTIELLTGSGSALQVFYNQTDLGPLGLFGEVVQRTFTPNEIILPTATITPTPTISPTSEFIETPTMTPTATP